MGAQSSTVAALVALPASFQSVPAFPWARRHGRGTPACQLNKQKEEVDSEKKRARRLVRAVAVLSAVVGIVVRVVVQHVAEVVLAAVR